MSYLNQILADIEAGQIVTVEDQTLFAGYFNGPDRHTKLEHWAEENGLTVTRVKTAKPGLGKQNIEDLTFSKKPARP